MAQVTVTRNAIRIPDPAFFYVIARLGTGAAIGLVALPQLPRFRNELSYLQSLRAAGLPSNDWELIAGTVVPHLWFAFVMSCALITSAWLVVTAAYNLMGWLRRRGSGGPQAGPGDIDNSAKRSYDLLIDKRYSRDDIAAVPPLIIRIMLGDSAHWITPSAHQLLGYFDRIIKRTAFVALLVIVPPFLPKGWLVDFASSREVDQQLLNALQIAEQNVHWPFEFLFPLVMGATIVGLWMAIFLARGRHVRVEVAENSTMLNEKGDPDNFFAFLYKQQDPLQYKNIPNRPVGQASPPSIGSARIGHRGEFRSTYGFETQPQPIASGRNFASLFLGCLAGVITVCGVCVLLYDVRLVRDPMTFPNWFPAIVTGVMALSAGRQIQRLSRTLAYTFRFQSDLFRFDFFGTYTVSRFGVNAGDTGGVQTEIPYVQSNGNLVIRAARLVTEVSASSDSWSPIVDAMSRPRIIIDTVADDAFAERLVELSARISEYRPAPILPQLQMETGGMHSILNVNQQIAHYQKTVDRLPATESPPKLSGPISEK